MSSLQPRTTPLNLTINVDHVEPGRWIVAIDAPDGPFSTETDAASKVEAAARAAVAEVLAVVDVELAFVDFDGRPWSPLAADCAAAAGGHGRSVSVPLTGRGWS